MKHLKKIIFITFIKLVFPISVFSQYGLGAKLNYINTGKDFYVHMKNKFGGEIFGYYIWKDELRLRFSLMSNSFQSTHDTIPVYKEEFGSTFTPGILIHKKYVMSMAMMGADYLFPPLYFRERMRLYPGFDIGYGRISRQYQLNYYGLSETDADITYSTFGARLRLNFEIIFKEKSSLLFEFGTLLFWDEELGKYFGYSDFGIGFHYIHYIAE